MAQGKDFQLYSKNMKKNKQIAMLLLSLLLINMFGIFKYIGMNLDTIGIAGTAITATFILNLFVIMWTIWGLNKHYLGG